MGPQAKREYVEVIRGRYRRASRRQKGRILDEFCAVCSYHRKHAIALLGRRRRRERRRPGPAVRYGPAVAAVVRAIWLAAEQICSKRLKAALPLWLGHYKAERGALTEETRRGVLAISPASIDRLLRPVRARWGRRGRGGTQPGTLLRNQIPVRTEHWNVDRPGWIEADTVAHGGTSLAGQFVWSLTFTDIWSGWTELRAVWNKGAAGVVQAVRSIEKRLAFPVLGFDCDNGSEFLNHHLWRYFARRRQPVTFTRSRPYHRNDNAHVEQKQWTHVRQLLGYDRLDSPQLLRLINNLYANEWALLHNVFLPTLKLKSKLRVRSRYRKTYEPPQTPLQRLLRCPHVSPEAKLRLLNQTRRLNPFALKKTIERKLRRIFTVQRKAKRLVNEPPPDCHPEGAARDS